MKDRCLYLLIFTFLCVNNLFSDNYVMYDFDLSLNEFLEVSTRKDNLEPMVDSKRILLFYPPNRGIRKIFAAFDFDQYSKKYLFKKNEYRVFFVKVNIPHGTSEIKYRLIVNKLFNCLFIHLIKKVFRYKVIFFYFFKFWVYLS